jgi:TRAP-type C4-dicarboxylate transport system substrate-binding protein
MIKRMAMTIAGSVLLLAAAGSAFAEDPVELTFSTWVPPKFKPLFAGLSPWAESIEKESNGLIKIRFIEGGALGAAKDHYDMAANGVADITWISPGYTPGRFPIIARAELPFAMGGSAGDDSAALRDFYDAYADKEMSEVKVLLTHANEYGTFHFRDASPRLPEGVSGLKVRPANAAIAQWVAELGGATVQIPAPEAREAVAKGTVDAITLQWGSLGAFKIDKVTKHHIDDDFYTSIFAVVMNKDTYAKLSDGQKKVIDAHATPEWSARIGQGWGDWEITGEDALRAAEGHDVYTLSDEERRAWVDSAKPIYEAWEKDVRGKWGLDPAMVDADFRASLSAHNATSGD